MSALGTRTGIAAAFGPEGVAGHETVRRCGSGVNQEFSCLYTSERE